MTYRDSMIIDNMRFVSYIIGKYFSNTTNVDKEDLFQSGCIGLIKAVDTYDEKHGIKFSTYASRVIYNEICAQFRRSRVYTVNPMYDSLEAPIGYDKEGDAITLSDVLSSEDVVVDTIEENINLTTITGYLMQWEVSPRFKSIVTDYLTAKLEDKVSQSKIGEKYGVSQCQVSRIVNRFYDFCRSKYEEEDNYENRISNS